MIVQLHEPAPSNFESCFGIDRFYNFGSSTNALGSQIDVKREFDSYIGSNFSVGYDQNAMKAGNFPFVYWKDKGRQFPTLRSLARVYLSIPATSVPSERVFSLAGRVLTDRRSMLSGKRLEMLVVCKKNFSLW